MKIFNYFISFFTKKQIRRAQFKKTLIIENNSSVKPQKNTITIVKKNNSYTWVKFICPCGCGKEVMLSLNPNLRPTWTLKINDKNKVTLSPSVYLTGFPCRSHFFIKKSNITWV